MIKKLLGLFTFVLLGYSFCFGDGGNGFCGNPVSEGLKFSLNMGDNIVQSDLNNSNLILKNHGNFYTDSDNFNGDYLYYKFLYNSTYYFTYIFFRSNNGLYWGDYNSQSNSYGTITRHQGYVNYLCEFDGLTDACYLNPGTTCNSNGISIVSSGNVYTNESYYNPDKVDFYWWGSSYPTICFRYTSKNLTLCATYNVGQNYNTSNLTYTEGNLLSSTDPNNFNSNIFVNSPWGSPNEGGGTTPNKQNYICPTFGQLLKQQNFNTGLCYNTTLRIENGQLTTIPQKNIQEAFTDYEEFTNYRTIYKNKCDTIQGITEDCENTFTGEIEKYIIIANAEETGINKKILWNNCNIALNYDLNRTTCVASGYIAEQPTPEELEDRIINGNYTTINDIYVPGSGNILNRLLEDGETREEKANRDILGNFTQLVGKITSIFNARNGVEGVIPEYILWLIFVSLFLTVILKK